MPPKKNQKAGDDKTFGMKNKKGAKAQKFIQLVETQKNQNKGKEAAAKAKAAEDRKIAKEAADQKKRLDAQLFGTTAQVQKVPFGTDPKTVLCVFFKAGTCQKGNKCKFSHDRNIERKVDKLNIYEDQREAEKKEDSMDTWDDNKLKDVVNQKGTKQKTTTDIVCKHFIQAIEDRKYGWFWICPNGGDSCMYRHALPPGFILKKDQDKEKKEEISLEDFVEVERHKLKPPLTPVTEETFAAWKKQRVEKKQAEKEALEKAKTQQRAAGKLTGMTGKDMFEFAGELYEEADEGAEDEEEWDISRMLARYREEEDADGEKSGEGRGDGQDVEAVTNGLAQVSV